MLERRVDEAEGRAEAMGLGACPRRSRRRSPSCAAADKVDAELAAMKAPHRNKEG